MKTQDAEIIHEIISPVDAEFSGFKRAFQRELQSPNTAIEQMLQKVCASCGKRIRPLLILLAGKAAGEVTPLHTGLAVTMELVHTATLVHDDVLDESELRRSLDTVNARWGNQQSILLGDYLFSQAFHLSTKLDSARLSGELAQTTNRVALGELMQTKNRFNYSLTEGEYIEIIDMKTASFFTACCRIGSRYGGAGALEDGFAEYGKNIGVAFQIADDLLDVVGTEYETGKTLGTDLAQGKVTMPLIHLLTNSAPNERDAIVRLITPPVSAEEKSRIDGMLEDAGSISYTRERMEDFIRTARAAIKDVPQSAAKQSLLMAADYIVHRNQ
jgi:octaprenyl-diphosphate synthase